jgi:hypothetical protein
VEKNMHKESEIKSKVLQMLEQFMSGEHGKRLKPKVVSVEVMADKHSMGEGSLKDVLKRASEENDDADDFHDDGVNSFDAECDYDDADDEDLNKRTMSPKHYFTRK